MKRKNSLVDTSQSKESCHDSVVENLNDTDMDLFQFEEFIDTYEVNKRMVQFY